MTATTDERERTLELMNEELVRRMEMQFTIGDRIDTKATLLIGFVAASSQFVLTQPHRSDWTTKLALAGYGLAFAAGLSALALRSYRAVPKPAWLLELYERLLREGTDSLRRTMLGRLVALRSAAAVHNARVDQHKSWAWWISLAALGVGVLFSIISLA